MSSPLDPTLGSGGMHSQPLTSRVSTRAVRPGSCQRCMYCHDMIEYKPGGSRMQVTRWLYTGEVLHHSELFHPECYRAFEDNIA